MTGKIWSLSIRGGMTLLCAGGSIICGPQSVARAAPAPEPRVALGARPLEQVALTTRDLPRAVSFYRDVLGLPMMFESNGMAFFDVAGMRLMIAHDPERPQGKPTSIVYFHAPDFDATLAGLARSRVNFDGPVETVQSTPAGDLKLQQFRDPDGNALAIMAMVPAAKPRP